ncbi:autotransporter adhesin BpaC [Anopheles bellator]|uniref:autotransporter adhesin BpaC n=1 Tax=Anopheles bellator TaxID=139047 RepID=UPI0026481FF1|nr:autotransporter adhesin BpaC [Anopheles bellator]
MSAPENAKAQSAPDHHHSHHQNVVVPATTAPALSTAVAAAAQGAVATGVLSSAATVSATPSAPATAIGSCSTASVATADSATAIHANASNNSVVSGGSSNDESTGCTKNTSAGTTSGSVVVAVKPPGGGDAVVVVAGTKTNVAGVSVASSNAAPELATGTESGTDACAQQQSSGHSDSGSATDSVPIAYTASDEAETPTGFGTSPSEAAATGTADTAVKVAVPVAPDIAAPAVASGSGSVGGSNGGTGGSTGTVVASLSRARGELGEKHTLEYHCRMLEGELQAVKESETKLKQQYSESQRRERLLVRRLTIKEQEIQDYVNQITELKAAQAPGPAALRSALLDPAVNILFQKLKAELQATKAKLEETQNELSAWKFTPDSNTGKRLMAKCRLLYQENEELGKMTSNGRLAKLESELALQKSYNEEVKKSQLELDDFLQELDEDVEGMQGTIVFLQQELKQTKDGRDELEKELAQLRAYVASLASNDPSIGTPTDESAMDALRDNNSTYHNPDGGGGGADSIGGMGGGVTPIYLVNGGSTNSANSSGRLLVNKSSSGDQDLVYNRTHCGGVVNNIDLRTTPSTGASNSNIIGMPAATTAPSGSSFVAAAEPSGSVVNGTTTFANSSSDIVVGAEQPHQQTNRELLQSIAVAGSAPLGRTNSSNNSTSSSSSSCGGDGGSNFATVNSVNSGSNSGGSSSGGNSAVSAASTKPQQQQQLQQHRPTASHNAGGRNGGRTTVGGTRKRNYNETDSDASELLAHSEVVSGVGDAYGSESGGAGVEVPIKDNGSGAGVADSVANGKPLATASLVAASAATDGSFLLSEQDDSNSNKRMTRSGKGKAVAATTAALSSTSSLAGSMTVGGFGSSAAAANVLVTSAAKKLRRGSVAMDDESDSAASTIGDTQHLTNPPQHTAVSSANGSN